ncbi:glycosyltransferase family 9 protein, partial [Bdellovibrionota bacterium FG-2]
IFYGGADSLGLDFLAGLFSAMQVVVAPSTGPLHLAVALGKPVVSFYPPIRVQSAKRWGPLLGEALSPDVSCGQDFRCLGSACPHYLCMELIKVEDAVKCVLEKL